MMAELSCCLPALPGHPVTLGLGPGTNHPAAWGGGDPGSRTSVLKPAKCRQEEVVTLQGPKALSSFLETSPDRTVGSALISRQ